MSKHYRILLVACLLYIHPSKCTEVNQKFHMTPYLLKHTENFMLDNEEMAQVAKNVPQQDHQQQKLSYAQKKKQKVNLNQLKEVQSTHKEVVHEVNQAAELGIVDQKFVEEESEDQEQETEGEEGKDDDAKEENDNSNVQESEDEGNEKSQKLTDLKNVQHKKKENVEADEEDEIEKQVHQKPSQQVIQEPANDKKKQYMLSIMGEEDQKIFKKQLPIQQKKVQNLDKQDLKSNDKITQNSEKQTDKQKQKQTETNQTDQKQQKVLNDNKGKNVNQSKQALPFIKRSNATKTSNSTSDLSMSKQGHESGKDKQMVQTEQEDGSDCDDDGDVPEHDENVETFNAETDLQEEKDGAEVSIRLDQPKEEEEEVDLYTQKPKIQKEVVKQEQAPKIFIQRLADNSTQEIQEIKNGLDQVATNGTNEMNQSQSRAQIQTEHQLDVEAVKVVDETELSEHLQISDSIMNVTIVQNASNDTNSNKPKIANLTQDALKSWEDQGYTNSLMQKTQSNSSLLQTLKDLQKNSISNETSQLDHTQKLQNLSSSNSSSQHSVQLFERTNITQNNQSLSQNQHKKIDPLLEHSIEEGEISISNKTSNQTSQIPPSPQNLTQSQSLKMNQSSELKESKLLDLGLSLNFRKKQDVIKEQSEDSVRILNKRMSEAEGVKLQEFRLAQIQKVAQSLGEMRHKRDEQKDQYQKSATKLLEVNSEITKYKRLFDRLQQSTGISIPQVKTEKQIVKKGSFFEKAEEQFKDNKVFEEEDRKLKVIEKEADFKIDRAKRGSFLEQAEHLNKVDKYMEHDIMMAEKEDQHQKVVNQYRDHLLE